MKERRPSWAPRPYGLCARKTTLNEELRFRAQELCESRGGRPGLPVPNSPFDLRSGRKTTLNEELRFRAQELCESRSSRPGLPVSNSAYDLCVRKATLNLSSYLSELRSCEKVEVLVLGSPK